MITKSSTSSLQAPLCVLHAGLDHIQALQVGECVWGSLLQLKHNLSMAGGTGCTGVPCSPGSWGPLGELKHLLFNLYYAMNKNTEHSFD